MKLFKTILISLVSVGLAGCIGDDYSNCLQNYTLCFDYPDFPDHIHKMNVGIFDSDGVFVAAREVDNPSLSGFRGVHFRLTGGNYVAVCWGNAFDHTRIDGFTHEAHLDAVRVFHPGLHTSQPVPSNDSLYYGKLNFTIPEKYAVREDTVALVPAHITLQIEVKGLSNTATGTPVAEYPFLRVNNLLAVYDSGMQTLGDPVSYYPPVRVDTSDKRATACCDVLRFGNDTPATIDVVENALTNEILYTVDLRDFMLANGIVIVSGQEVTIPILITFFDGNVTVTLQGWGGTPIKPEV